VFRLVINALLLQAWSPNVATYWSYNAPSWSVSCELFAYAVFPLAFAALRRRTLIRTGTIVAVIFCAIVAVDEVHPGVDASWLGGMNPISCFGAFAVGIATGVWRRKLPSPRPGYGRGTVIQAGALALALGANAFFASYPIIITLATAEFFLLFGATPFYGALLLALARYDGMISRGLSCPAVVYGGKISYSIYLFHQIFIRWHSDNLQVFTSVPMWCQYAGLLATTLIAAAAVHHVIERPARQGIRAAWKRLTSKMATAA
jgi:peptidoglycan/LPS O-acetylase OafA/YrhL